MAALDRDGEGVAALCATLGESALPLTGDVSRRADVEAAVAAVLARWRRIDVLVNNAGLVRDATLRKATDEDWSLTLDVNLKGAFLCGRAIAPGMAERGYGRIVSASSVVARTGNFGQSAYAASKAGIIGLTRTWARELGGARHHRQRGGARLHRHGHAASDPARPCWREAQRPHPGGPPGPPRGGRERLPLPRLRPRLAS